MPVAHCESDGYRLGIWVRYQRHLHRSGTLPAQRAEQLTALPGWSWTPRADRWQDGFAHLQRFAQREGHAVVPATHRESDGYRLGQWTLDQRHRHRKGILEAERAERLAALPGWTWDKEGRSEKAWETWFACLQGFAQREGHTRVAFGHLESDGHRLGQWVAAQRRRYREGELPAELAARLAALPGWTWDKEDRSDSAWEAAFARLQDFVQREGHAAVVRTYREGDGYRLGHWAGFQREQHARGVLADDRAGRLAALPGWTWDPHADAWEAGIARLQNFVQREGHARVLATFRETDGYRLGRWVYHQRRLHRQGTLAAERAGRLAALPGWSWTARPGARNAGDAPQRDGSPEDGSPEDGSPENGAIPADGSAWEFGFARLRDFAQREGHAQVTARYRDSDGYGLGRWAHLQRRRHRQGTLPAERAARLAALPGWTWSPTGTDRPADEIAWEAGFARLQDYAQREGDAQVTARYRDSDGYPLGQWAHRQRHSRRLGRLTAERAERLTALPGWYWDPLGLPGSGAAEQDGYPGTPPGQPRRTFSAAYKARILTKYSACRTARERSALLRREGLTSSHIGHWRSRRDTRRAGALDGEPARRPERDAAAAEAERCARSTSS